MRQLSGLVAELHDAFNSLLPINLVDLGLFPASEAVDALIGAGRGDALPLDPYSNVICGPRGRLPVNMSGGLKSRGHPVGGTGLFQIAELWLQLLREFPNPKAQASDARVGLAHSIGGPGNNVYVTLIERRDNDREVASDLPPAPGTAVRRAPARTRALRLSGKDARVEAATTIHVTADAAGPIHVALLSIGDRRVFAKLDAPVQPGQDPTRALAGRRARFLVKDDGDHYFQLVREGWDLPTLWRSMVDKLRGAGT